MKNMLPLFFLLLSTCSLAQVNAIMSPQAKSFFDKAMLSIKPEIKNTIEKNANKLRHQEVDVDSLVNALHKNPLFTGGNEKDLKAITILILVQLSRDADEDLKSLVVQYGRSNHDTSSKAEAESIVTIKSVLAESVSDMLIELTGSPEMAMEKFK